MMRRDQHGNIVWVERLWNALPHWLRRRVGFLFPAKKVVLPKAWDTLDEYGFDHDHEDPLRIGRVGCRACVLRLNAQTAGRPPARLRRRPGVGAVTEPEQPVVAQPLRAALEKLRGYPYSSTDKDAASVYWASDPIGAYVRWDDLVAAARLDRPRRTANGELLDDWVEAALALTRLADDFLERGAPHDFGLRLLTAILADEKAVTSLRAALAVEAVRPDLVEAAGGEQNVPAYLRMEAEQRAADLTEHDCGYSFAAHMHPTESGEGKAWACPASVCALEAAGAARCTPELVAAETERIADDNGDQPMTNDFDRPVLAEDVGETNGDRRTRERAQPLELNADQMAGNNVVRERKPGGPMTYRTVAGKPLESRTLDEMGVTMDGPLADAPDLSEVDWAVDPSLRRSTKDAPRRTVG